MFIHTGTPQSKRELISVNNIHLLIQSIKQVYCTEPLLLLLLLLTKKFSVAFSMQLEGTQRPQTSANAASMFFHCVRQVAAPQKSNYLIKVGPSLTFPENFSKFPF